MKKSTRVLILVCLFALSTGLIAYSALGLKHEVGPDAVSEVAFTHLSHSGQVARGEDGKLAYTPYYTPEETAKTEVQVEPAVAEEPVAPDVVTVAETKPAPKPAAKATPKPAAKKTEPAKPAVKDAAKAKKPSTGSTAKKPTPAKPSKPAEPKKPETKKPEPAKPAPKAPEKKPEAPKPACPT